MPIIKERIKFNNQDVNLKINLGVGNNISGYQQEIDELTENVKVELTNPIIDNEVRRFQYNNTRSVDLYFYFSANGVVYSNSFDSTGARYDDSEIENVDDKIRNSFFTMDFYDSFDDYTQSRIFTIYQTQILDGETSGNIPIPKYVISNNNESNNQFYSWYAPKTFIDKYIESGITGITGYVKFSFYNAKYGDLALFYNNAYVNPENPASPERMYFEVELDLINMTWKFNSSSFTQKAYQLPFTNLYSQKVNNNIEDFDNKQQDYPDDNTFDSENGTYVTL